MCRQTSPARSLRCPTLPMERFTCACATTLQPCRHSRYRLRPLERRQYRRPPLYRPRLKSPLNPPLSPRPLKRTRQKQPRTSQSTNSPRESPRRGHISPPAHPTRFHRVTQKITVILSILTCAASYICNERGLRPSGAMKSEGSADLPVGCSVGLLAHVRACS